MKKYGLFDLKPYMSFKSNCITIDSIVYHVDLNNKLVDISKELAKELLTKKLREISTNEIDLNELNKYLESKKLYVSANIYFKEKYSTLLNVKHFEAFTFFYT